MYLTFTPAPRPALKHFVHMRFIAVDSNDLGVTDVLRYDGDARKLLW